MCEFDFSMKERIGGKTIAIVYIFEGDNDSGMEHFFIWKSDIISLWLKAIQELNCLPLILDVRTFVDKAINKTLPQIDYVLNLNSGTYDLSSMALVPSVCSAIGVPCIPCNATTIVTGENKKISNYVASALGLNVPIALSKDQENGIFRPINLGNSMGVKRNCIDQNCDGIYQEFIEGYDITTPIVFNPITQKMDLLPTVIYLPDSKDPTWYNGEHQKATRSGYTLKIVEVDDKLKNKYIDLVNALSINTFCRIDARIRSNDKCHYDDLKIIASYEDTYFIEINVMPTIREFNNFVFSFNSIPSNSSFSEYIRIQKKIFGNISLNSFLLSSSMLGIKTMC